MLLPEYIVGLTDGEGSFTVIIEKKPRKPTYSRRVGCFFFVKMREDDLPLLKKVKKFFNCGGIYFQPEYRVNQRDNYRFQIAHLKDLQEKVIPFFREHKLQSKRIKDFRLFCKIVDSVQRKKHLTSNGLKRIEKLKKQMHQ